MIINNLHKSTIHTFTNEISTMHTMKLGYFSEFIL
ncbi:hypothetical protein SAMN05421857_3059 [Chryseobacterium formosense]|nr:hypothetical protein SAMN05421857_3059 [Chryseobacterium formosense]